ncbi:MAG: nucleotide exchange factor GrpE [Pseudonocardiaceae bacterium]
MSEVTDGVDSVQHEAASQGGVETALHPVGGSAVNAAGQPGQQDEFEPDEVAEPLPDPVAALAGSVGELAAQLRAHHARAQARERVIDQLHAEVERLRAGEQGLLLRPVVTDLQRLRGDLLHQAATLSPQIDQQQAAELLESFALSVELALERCGSLSIRPSLGTQFSAREHRAVKIVAAASPEEDGTIAAIVTDGYLNTSTDRVTAPACVHVRRWAPPEDSSPDGPDPADHAELSDQQESNSDV